MPTPVDVMKPFREEASQRLDILLPFTFTTIDVGTAPKRLFAGRTAVSGVTLQALSTNTGKIFVSNDSSITVDYGFSLPPGACMSWQVSLADVLQVLGMEGLGNFIPRERTPDRWSRFRQTRVSLDASQFWLIADAPDQHITVQLSHLPRF